MFAGATLLFTAGLTLKILLALAIVWSLIWKAIALWKAARNNQPAWFVVLLILNTLGILEIIYIFGFSSPKNLNKAQ